jgi:hypothetical protein
MFSNSSRDETEKCEKNKFISVANVNNAPPDTEFIATSL